MSHVATTILVAFALMCSGRAETVCASGTDCQEPQADDGLVDDYHSSEGLNLLQRVAAQVSSSKVVLAKGKEIEVKTGGPPLACVCPAVVLLILVGAFIVSGCLNRSGSKTQSDWQGQCSNVPFQAQQVCISWIFIVASIMLFFDFGSLQAGVAGEDSYFVKLGNWFGVVSCLGWFTGFVILVHWLTRLGATSMGIFAALMKLLASVFFNLQPMTGTAGTAGGAGIWWSNLTGILLFHGGNCLSCVDFRLHTPPGADRNGSWFDHGNLPITGMWVYQIATWFLVYSNLVTCGWGGDPKMAWVETGTWSVMLGQYAGSLLLLLGSLIYGWWCNAFATVAGTPP